jgi:hypothetical protein
VGQQGLDRRIPDKKTLTTEIAAWEKDRNKNHTKTNWQFNTDDARIELKCPSENILNPMNHL